MNSARQRIASLVRQYNTAEAMRDAEKATGARWTIYQILADTIRFIEKLARTVPEMRDDHAWAYHSLAALNTIDEGETAITAGVKDVMTSVANNFLPRTSAEATAVSTDEPVRFGCGSDDAKIDAPVDCGTLMNLLGRLGVLRSGYKVAQAARNTARCQDLRVAMHNQLGGIQAYVRFVANRLRPPTLRNQFVKDWNWVESAKSGLRATLRHEGMQPRSLEPLDEAEALPENCIPWADETDNPVGLWGSLIETDMQEAAIAEELTTRQQSWTTFVCGFRPGAAMVTVSRDVELRPSGDGGAFAFHTYAECGWLHRVRQAGEEWVGHRAWVEYWECPKCQQPIPQETTGTCPRCKCEMGQGDKARAVPARKAHIPLDCLPLHNETVSCNAKAVLHAGAWREVVVRDGREGVVVHPNKAETKARKGRPKTKGLVQIQWLDTGGLERIPEAEQHAKRREVFVYRPAQMDTTLGTAHFCFGTWLEFEAVEIQTTTNRFRIGDSVVISDPLLIRKTKLWGASSGKDKHTDRLRNEGVGKVVRVPPSSTSEDAARYDVKIGGFVLLGQQEDDLKPASGETNRISEPELKEGAEEFVNIFEAKAYGRYRKSGRGRTASSTAAL